jgi:sialate O-acetylesterase
MSALRLCALFSDHLVLQRGRENPIWGQDLPGQALRLVVVGGADLESRTTRAGVDGRFTLLCPELPAGGPYELHVRGSGLVVVRDVLVGEVWLASGQSNMEWPVAGTDDAEREIERAELPLLRQFKVEPRAAREPSSDLLGEWQVCSPASVARFSAVGYFFQRDLWEKLELPLGVIDATWGGTSIDAWTEVSALREVEPSVDLRLAELSAEERELPRIRDEYQAVLSAWERASFPADPPNVGFERGYASRDFDDSAWRSLDLPTFWQLHDMPFNGVVWFRRELELPNGGEYDLSLELGAIDDFDHTYVNGTLVGSHPDGTPNAFQLPRRYLVPKAVLRRGKNVIAVRVFDHFGQGGFAGPKRAMFAQGAAGEGERIPLSGPWRIAVEHEIPLVSGEVFASWPAPPLALALQNAPGALFNGMLAPIIPYGLCGVIWYQGEADVEQHATYGARFVAFIRDLRRRFADPQLCFLFVELAGFRANGTWPWLREAQASALREPHTFRATAIDIGAATDIHPRNKREVGRRLALLARARVYGERELEDSGPTFERAELEGAQVTLYFSHARGLRSRAGAPLRGFELSENHRDFALAQAQLAGDTVVLTAEQVGAPRAVRYAWADYPDATLENAAGLPAFPFRAALEP